MDISLVSIKLVSPTSILLFYFAARNGFYRNSYQKALNELASKYLLACASQC
jgi:hypothetical protein